MTFTPVASALLVQTIAASALTQLNRQNVFSRTGIVGYEPGAFEVGELVRVRRAKRRTAVSFDPRGGSDLSLTEGQWYEGQLSLERLWGDAFPIYSHDPSQSLEKYIIETAGQTADAISTPNDDYLYQKFTTWTAPTGPVALGANPPTAICAAVNSSNQIAAFDNNLLRNGSIVLDKQNVPQQDRFAVISTIAKGAFLGDAVVVNNLATTWSFNSAGLIETGLPNGAFVERYGFQVAGSNTVTGQTAVADMDTAAGTQAYLPVASLAANTNFTVGDIAATTYAGAIDFTLTASTALNVAAGGVAVGQIAQITDSSSNILAFGVILQIQSAGTTAPILTIIPYSPSGVLLPPAAFAATNRISVPNIGSVNVAYHREALLIANRFLREPSPGSGALAASVVDPQTNLTLQIFSGNYNVLRVRESQAAWMLTGATISDYRKGVLLLSL